MQNPLTTVKAHRISLLFFFLLLLLAPVVTHAHTGDGEVGGFTSGFLHPLFGLDHVVAMVAVGLWGAFLGRPAIWVLPITFPLVMAIGGVFGVLGVPFPAVEQMIAFSGILLGAMVLFAVKPPLAFAGIVVAFFAIFHGYAHGAELPEAASAVTFAVGFVLATGLLHLCGIALGLLTRWPGGVVAVRAMGGIICLIGFGFLFGVL